MEDAATYNIKAGLLEAQGKTDEALAVIEEARGRGMENAATHTVAGFLLLKKSRREAADEVIAAVQSARTPAHPALLFLAAACAQRKFLTAQTFGMLLRSAEPLEKTVRSTIQQIRDGLLPLEEWEEEIRGYVRHSCCIEVAERGLRPVNRVAYHVVHNRRTPGEREGMLHV